MNKIVIATEKPNKIPIPVASPNVNRGVSIPAATEIPSKKYKISSEINMK